ncbi:MAG: hypothetical protein WBA11_02405, partial [Rubrivirga sp.]
LLAVENDSWLETDEAPLTESAFRARLGLEVVFEDGDLFWGHATFVTMDHALGLGGIEIFG